MWSTYYTSCACFLFFVVVLVHLSPFPLLPATPAIPTSHPWSHPLLVLSMCPLCSCVPENASRFPSQYPLPPFLCQFALNLSVSGYILLACLLCWLGSTYRWNNMVFVFHTWFISLSIMLSSSMQAVMRVGVPSFFLLHSIPSCKCTIVFDPFIYWWALTILSYDPQSWKQSL